jgi:hypothetical protein
MNNFEVWLATIGVAPDAGVHSTRIHFPLWIGGYLISRQTWLYILYVCFFFNLIYYHIRVFITKIISRPTHLLYNFGCFDTSPVPIYIPNRFIPTHSNYRNTYLFQNAIHTNIFQWFKPFIFCSLVW